MITRHDLFRIGAAYVAGRSKFLDPRAPYYEGSDANVFVGAVSYMAYEVLLYAADRFGAHLISSAEDEDLDRKAYDLYRLVRPGAATSRGSVVFSRTKNLQAGGTVPAGTVLLTQGSPPTRYTTLAPASFLPGRAWATAPVRSVLAGASTIAGRYAIAGVERPASLFDPSITVTNDEPTVGGADKMLDPEFRELIRDYPASLRRGTLGAIEFGARLVPGVASAKAVEFLDDSGSPARIVVLYVADAAGLSNTVLAADVRNSLDEYRAGGVPVVVYSSTPELIAVALKLAFAAGAASGDLAERVQVAVLNHVNSLTVNAPLVRSDLYGVLNRFKRSGLIVTDASVASPAGDVHPTPGRTLRTTRDRVSLAA